LYLDLFPSLTIGQQQKILKSCTPELLELLSLDRILPYLYEHDLLTDKEEAFIGHPYVARRKKVTRLIMALPVKGPTALQRFVDCLRSSSQGTGHDEIAYLIEELVGHSRSSKGVLIMQARELI
jgi:hypothetical protein